IPDMATEGDRTVLTSLEQSLRDEAALIYTSRFMSKLLTGWGSVMSERPVKELLRRSLPEESRRAVDIERIYKDGETFCIPYTGKNGSEFLLRFHLDGDVSVRAGDEQCVSIDGGNARVVVERVGGSARVEDELEHFRATAKAEKVKPEEELADIQKGKLLIDSVFQGGGAKGVAYGGALDVVAEKDMWFRKIAGTSAGAITASLIAAGYDHNEMREIIMETDFNDFKDRKWGFLPAWLNMLLFGGLYWGRYFEKWIDKRFQDKLGFSPTMKDLPVPLTVIASNISDQQMLILDKDTAPDLKVSTAVRMSMGIPFFFDVFKWFGAYRKHIKARRVVDGGLLSNFPLFVLENDGQHGVPVLGFRLDEIKRKKEHKTFWSTVLGWLGKLPLVRILLSVLSTGMDAHDNRHIEDDDWARIVNIPVDVGTTDFDLSKAKKEELMERGRIATEKVLDKKLAEANRQKKEKASILEAPKKKRAATRQQGAEKPSEELVSIEEHRAQDLIDGLVLMAVEADINKQEVILAIDTGLIPEEQKHTSAMNGLLRALRDLDLRNVTICHGAGTALYERIAGIRETSSVPKRNIVVLGRKELLASDLFDPLRPYGDEEIGAYFAEVLIPEDFPYDGDTEIIKIAAIAMREACKQQKASRRREFQLKAEPVGIDRLVDKLERQTERISA
ncbi:MAG: hypothetical protein GF392_05715, partial [Candidatus Omnitrophica bacterium]|nr:hypothetical protein [Candidatus Omnitrophota bacterium]